MSLLLILLFLSGITDARERTLIGLKHFEVFDFFGAHREFEAALRLAPDSEVARLNLGLASYYLGQFSEARTIVQEVLHSNPSSGHAVFLMGVLEKVSDHPDAAILHFRKLIEIDPGDFAAYYQLGLLAFARGDFSEAARFFVRTLERNTNCSSAMYNLGRSLIRDGKVEEGREVLERFQAVRQREAARETGGMGEPTLLQGKYAQVRQIP